MFFKKKYNFFLDQKNKLPRHGKTEIFHHGRTIPTRLHMQTRLHAEHINLTLTAIRLIVTLGTCEGKRPPWDPHAHSLQNARIVEST